MEIKGSDDLGISVSIVFPNGEEQKIHGFGQETGDISLDALKNALAKARRDASHDPEFHSLPKPEEFGGMTPSVQPGYHDESLMELSPEDDAVMMTEFGWDTIRGACDESDRFLKKKKISPKEAGLIVSGDQTIIRERMAVGTLSGIADFDETTILMSFVTAMVETGEGKGSGINVAGRRNEFDPYQAGRNAARSAIQGVNGTRFPTGKYKVVFGRSAMVDLFHLLRDSLSLDEELLRRVGEGIYIGRLWYTYPVGGYSTGIFSGTAIADIYRIRDGKIADPIKPNTIRVTDNMKRLLNSIIGISDERHPTVAWASDEIVYEPLMAVDEVPLEEISKFLE